MSWIWRAAAIGAGFGLAAAAIDLWFMFLGVLARRMPLSWSTLAESALVLIALGTVLGLLNSISLRSQRRAAMLLHLAGLCGAWLLVESWVWIEAWTYALTSLARPLGAGAFMLVVLLLERSGRRFAPLLWALAALAIAGVFAPGAYVAATTPDTPPRAALPPAREGAPDVVLVVLDTIRADHMGSYGYTRDTSPTFDGLAREGAWFADATAPGTWSLPSHASLFTGRYPSSHGATRSRSALDDRYPTLAQVLAARGYETFCFTANAWISDGVGLTRGFAVQSLSWKTELGGSSFKGRLLDRIGLGPADKGGARVAHDFAGWRSARAAGAPPAFVFLNFLEAHVPYHRLPREYSSRFTDLPRAELRRISLDIIAQPLGGPKVDLSVVTTPARAMYDGGVAYTDELLRRVVDALRESGTLDRTILVVLADHGEVLGERGNYFGHGPSVYQSVVHVPLLVRYPPRVAPGTRVNRPVSTLGVFATVLDLAEIEPPPTLQVGSLVRTADGGAEAPILSEMISKLTADPNDAATDPQMLAGQHLRAYRSGSWKLVESNLGGPFLFDLARDPTEARNLATERPEELKRLAGELEAARVRLGLPKLSEISRLTSAPAPELDAETQQRLRDLGYLQ
jgi:arylsulfatase A-like enzyme